MTERTFPTLGVVTNAPADDRSTIARGNSVNDDIGNAISDSNPLPVSLVGSSVTLSNDTAHPVPVAVQGSVEIANDIGNPLPVSVPGSVAVTGSVILTSASFSRPADTTAYAIGDLIANSTTAGSVTPLSFNVGVSKGLIRAASLKVGTSALASGTSLRLHLWSQSPTTTGGDNAAVFVSGAALVTSAGYLGYVNITVDTWFSDGASGRAAPVMDVHFNLGAGTTIYGLIEARSALTPANAAVITASISGLPA